MRIQSDNFLKTTKRVTSNGKPVVPKPKTSEREAQNKSVLNSGTVAALVETENLLFKLVRD